MHPRTYFVNSVRRRRRQSRADEYRQVEQIISHERDFAVCQTVSVQDLGTGGALVDDALNDDWNAELGGSPGRGRGRTSAEQADLQTLPACPDQSRTVANKE